MGDFTWHTSDPDHTVIDLGPRSNTLAPFNAPVYLLAPDGHKWREDNYEGYGVFGGVLAGAELARWNFGAKIVEGKTDEELHSKSVEISIRPYGGPWTKAPVFPLKFSRDPDAVYEDLPAAIPAAGTSECYGIDHFDVVLADGTRLDTSEARKAFWLARAEELNMFVDQAPETEERAWDWIGQTFWDDPQELVLPKGVRLVYTGYKTSLHQLQEMQITQERHWDNPMSWRRLTAGMTVDRLENLAELFDAGVREGVRDYERSFAEQLARYEAGQPLSTDPLHGPDEVMDVMWWDPQHSGYPSDRQVHTLGRIAGAQSTMRQRSWEREEMDPVTNPLRFVLRTR